MNDALYASKNSLISRMSLLFSTLLSLRFVSNKKISQLNAGRTFKYSPQCDSKVVLNRGSVVL